MASRCNKTSQKHSNVEWSETIQNVAMSCINVFSWVSAFWIFFINIQSLGLRLELFPLYHPIISLSLLTLCLLTLILHKLGLGNKGKGESILLKLILVSPLSGSTLLVLVDTWVRISSSSSSSSKQIELSSKWFSSAESQTLDTSNLIYVVHYIR